MYSVIWVERRCGWLGCEDDDTLSRSHCNLMDEARCRCLPTTPEPANMVETAAPSTFPLSAKRDQRFRVIHMHDDDALDERATCAQKKINVAETGVWPTKGWLARGRKIRTMCGMTRAHACHSQRLLHNRLWGQVSMHHPQAHSNKCYRLIFKPNMDEACS